MLRRKLVSVFKCALLLLTFSGLFEFIGTQIAEARIGGGRSSGTRSSSPSSVQSQPRQYMPSQQQPMSSPKPQSPNPNRGSFMRGLAGGVAGGVLGSMLFSSLGHSQGAAGFDDRGGGFGGSGTGGGIGIIEIILLAVLGYFVFRWWKNRQLKTVHNNVPYVRIVSNVAADPNQNGYFDQTTAAYPANQSLGPTIDSETAQDIFFRVQGAWTRRNLSSVHDFIGSDIAQILENDLKELKQNHRINRLENISIRNVDIGESWREGQVELVQVRFSANLLDYTVDETSNEVKEGSNSIPVKFEEIWIFSRGANSSSWQLAGIQQV